MCMLAGWTLSILLLPQDHEQHCIYPISGSPVNLKCICERNQNQRRQRRNMQTAYAEKTPNRTKLFLWSHCETEIRWVWNKEVGENGRGTLTLSELEHTNNITTNRDAVHTPFTGRPAGIRSLLLNFPILMLGRAAGKIYSWTRLLFLAFCKSRKYWTARVRQMQLLLQLLEQGLGMS